MTANLPILSRNYLLGRLSDKNSAKRELISNSPQSVPYLLRESVQVCKEFNPLPNMRYFSSSQVNGVMNRNMWIMYVAKPAISDTFAVIQAGGEPASDALVRGLYKFDPLIKVFSGLVLLEFDYVSNRLTEQMWRAFTHINDLDKQMPYYRESGQFIMFCFVMHKGGHAKFQEIVNDMLRKNNISFDEQRSRVKNTMFEYLFPQTGY